jgi:hypothetical protein
VTLNIDAFQKWVTLTAAALAAVASFLNLWWTHREKADRIKVACGLIDPQISPGEFLHVVSMCDHPVRLADYGYVTCTGLLLSLPQLDTDEPYEDQRITYGNLLLENRNASFETGTILRDHPVGVYARTTSQSRPTIAFRHDTPIWMRCWLRMKIWKKVGQTAQG